MELGKVVGFWSALQTATANKSQVFEYWAVSSLATDTGEKQSAVPCDNDVIRSDWVRPIGLRHLEFHVRTLHFLFGALCSVFHLPEMLRTEMIIKAHLKLQVFSPDSPIDPTTHHSNPSETRNYLKKLPRGPLFSNCETLTWQTSSQKVQNSHERLPINKQTNKQKNVIICFLAY